MRPSCGGSVSLGGVLSGVHCDQPEQLSEPDALVALGLIGLCPKVAESALGEVFR